MICTPLFSLFLYILRHSILILWGTYLHFIFVIKSEMEEKKRNEMRKGNSMYEYIRIDGIKI